jgi:hypothetical protein
MKSVAMVLAVAGFTSISGSAFATVTTINIGNTFAAGTTSFSNDFTFNVPASMSGSASAQAMAGYDWDVTLVPTVTFSSFNIYSGTPSGSHALLSQGTLAPDSLTATVGVGHLSFGSYFLEATGNVTTPAEGGWYSGGLRLATVPVPEPGEWALMLSGLGLIGFVIRRKSSRAG